MIDSGETVFRRRRGNSFRQKDRMLTAEKTGSYTLTLTADSGASVEIPVIVKKAPAKVSISADHSTLCVGETLYCSAVLPEGSAGSVSFSSSKPHFLRNLIQLCREFTGIQGGIVTYGKL